MFKRRAAQSLKERLARLWPRKGWMRAGSYVLHRLRRLPDPPYRVARGVAAGIFVSFTPFFGFHFVLAAALAWAMRGNLLASLLATFIGNPFTFPLIATVSVEIGLWLLGIPGHMPLNRIVGAFSGATLELWDNTRALFTSGEAGWDQTLMLLDRVFLPYLVGGFLPGLACASLGYMLTHRLVAAHRRRRIRRLWAKARRGHAAQPPAGTPPQPGKGKGERT